jgi:hypothetical protein
VKPRDTPVHARTQKVRVDGVPKKADRSGDEREHRALLISPDTKAAATPSCCPFTALISEANEKEMPCWRS